MSRIFDEKQIQELMDQIKLQGIFIKDILSLSEAAVYMNLSKSYLYKLTSAKKITYFKPGAKRIYFRKADLDQWMLRSKITSNEQFRINPKSGELTIFTGGGAEEDFLYEFQKAFGI